MTPITPPDGARSDSAATVDEQRRRLAKQVEQELCDHCGHPRAAHGHRFSTHGTVNGFVCRATVHGVDFDYPCPCNLNSFKAAS